MASLVPSAGSLYANPPIPGDFALDAAAAAVPIPVLATSYAVTAGPDRNLYWVYSTMASTATAISAPVVSPCCFETRNSLAVSQRKTRARQHCTLCQQIVSRHMTAAQAATAFTAHAAAFPATHATLAAAVPAGVAAPAGYASVNGITAPIAAPVIVPPPAAAAILAAPAVIPAAAAVGPDAPSMNASAHQYKLLTEMVKINSKLVWSNEREAHQFVTGLESILEISPVLHVHWTSLIMMMVPGNYDLERTWIRNTIITPQLSWNAAKTAFINHFQHGDYLDGRRLLYSQCLQSQTETTQEYSRRFQTLSSQLGYGDGDSQSIYRYIHGLHQETQSKLIAHKLSMRTIGAAPAWDFVSLTATARLAITMGTEPLLIQHTTGSSTLPLHLRQSALANPPCLPPISTPTSSTTSTLNNSNRKQSPTQQLSFRKRKASTSSSGNRTHIQEEKKCQYHPESKSHSTEECRTKGEGVNPNPPQGRKPLSPSPSPKHKPPPPSAPASSLQQIECFRCHQFGHYANQCPQLTVTSTNNKKKQLNRYNARQARITWQEGNHENVQSPGPQLRRSSRTNKPSELD